MDLLNSIKADENYSDYMRFYNLLSSENKKYNLTSIEGEEDFLIKHIADCIAFSDLYDDRAKIVEIGSGGGFPSVPLKIKRKDLDMTLIDSNEKKVAFLENVKRLFGFENFNCICGRAEELSKGALRESFDYAIARAVAPMNVLCELLLPFVKTGGKMIAYKGKNYKEELSLAENAIDKLGGRIKKICDYDLGTQGDRAIIVVEKITSTPEIYPRRYAKIKKSTL